MSSPRISCADQIDELYQRNAAADGRVDLRAFLRSPSTVEWFLAVGHDALPPEDRVTSSQAQEPLSQSSALAAHGVASAEDTSAGGGLASEIGEVD